MKKHILDSMDLSLDSIDTLISLAQKMMEKPKDYATIANHKILATCFFEPSTRTRLSFESAMLSLGGNVIGFSSGNSSSASKGESVSDTAQTVSCYADIIAMRHPKEGAPQVASNNLSVPLINAGDGGHNHPTQTLTDLMTIVMEKGRLSNLKVGVCGDLKFGRTVHSLIRALSRYEGIEFVLISPEELKVPDYIRKDVLENNNIPFVEIKDLEKAIVDIDVLYMTRIQQERFSSIEEYERLKNSYILDKNKMNLAQGDCAILHPLPRVNEIDKAVDEDPRSAYFRQVYYGKYIRMALIATLLELVDEKIQVTPFVIEGISGYRCVNNHCITSMEKDIRHLAKKQNNNSDTFRCVYCESQMIDES